MSQIGPSSSTADPVAAPAQTDTGAPDDAAVPGEGPSSHETCGQFPADEIAGK
jgi:hypothetical protein